MGKIRIAYLREIFKGGEPNNCASFSVDDRNCKIGCFNKLQNFRVRVDAVVYVVFPDFDQVNDCVGIVGISPPDDYAVGIKVKVLLLLITLTSVTALRVSAITSVSPLHLIFYTFHSFLLSQHNSNNIQIKS